MRNKKKILFFLFSLNGGGAERTTVNIINNLNKDKYNIILVLGTNKNNDYGELIDDKVKIHILKSAKLRYCLFKLNKVIREEKPDLLFSTINSNNIILLLAKLLFFKSIPVVVRETSNRTKSGKVNFVNRLLTSYLYNKFSSKIIALSNGVRDDLINNFYIDKNKVKVIYNPVEIDKIKKMSKEKVYDFEKRSNEKVVIAVGRLVDAKDYETLFRAFKLVLEKVNSRLIVLGKGPLESDLKHFSKTLGIEKFINFMGFKSNPYKYMEKADVFVLSSKWEGFGHVIVEAMATETPVISTNCQSGPSEIIGKNENGMLVPVGDPKKLANAIVTLLNDRKLMMQYITKGKKRALDFNASIIVKEYEDLFDSLLKTKN